MQFDKTYFLKSNKELFAETLKEFSTHSFELSSLNNIIKNSSFNKGSFYYRFADKIDLYVALFYDIIVKQYECVDKLKKNTISDATLKDNLYILFESQFDLYIDNPLYIFFLRNFSMESIEFKEYVIKRSQQPFIDSFISGITSFLISKKSISQNEASLIINQIKLSYYNFDQYVSLSSQKTFISDIVDFILSGINNFINDLDDISSSTIPQAICLFHEFNEVNQIFVLNNEILSIIGPKSCGKSNFLTQLYVKYEENNPNLAFKIRNDKSLQWNLDKCNLNLVNNSYIDLYLEKTNLFKHKKSKIKTLPPSSQKMTELLLKYLKYPQIIIVDDLFDFISNIEKEVVLGYLHEWKNTGSSIVLSSRHIQDTFEFSDRIGFLVNGALINIKSVYELCEKYGKITHIVKYLDNSSTKVAAFSNNNFNSEFFKKIIDQHTILSLETKAILPDEVFKLETGVNLG